MTNWTSVNVTSFLVSSQQDISLLVLYPDWNRGLFVCHPVPFWNEMAQNSLLKYVLWWQQFRISSAPLSSQYSLPNWQLRPIKIESEKFKFTNIPWTPSSCASGGKNWAWLTPKKSDFSLKWLEYIEQKNGRSKSQVVSSWVLIDDRLPDVEEGCESSAAATHKAFLCDDNMSGLKKYEWIISYPFPFYRTQSSPILAWPRQ